MRLLAAALLLAGCGTDPPTRRTSADPAPPVAPPAPRACPAPTVAAAGFRHDRSAVLAHLDPHHAATDVVAAAGTAFSVGGKLTYGPTGKDLEDEDVALWIADTGCDAHEVARGTTDDDGRVVLAAPAHATGAYRMWLVVAGDGTTADATAWIVAPASPTVVFDIDGTLTTADSELLEELVTGDPADMRPDGDRVARYWADHGHLVVYLTGRPYLLRRSTRAWLDSHGFPPGPVLTSDRVRDALPGGSVLGFKTDAVRALLAAGVDPIRVYGNAATDVCAYARGGVAPDRTFIVGPDARRCDDHPPSRPLNSYTDHLRELGSSQDAR